MPVDVVVDVVLDGDGDGDVTEIPQPGPPSNRWTYMLSFQKVDVYRCSVDLLALVATLPKRVPRGFSSLSEQLRRAALSVPLNIAEAAGRNSAADAARHYSIARGSAMECAAILDGLHALSVIEGSEHARAIELLERVVAMLTKLCR